MKHNLLAIDNIECAYNRIKDVVHRTPVVQSTFLNSLLGHNIFFKLESLQKVGSFKARGAINTLLALKQNNSLPKEIVAYSSGNHAQAVAWAAKILDVRATVYMSPQSSLIKRKAAEKYGAQVIIANSRIEAEESVYKQVAKGAYFIHPSNNEHIIAGAGTACLEALQEIKNIDAIFAPCGGGGLVSGTYLASKILCPSAQVFAAEPILANDASQSVKSGSIVKFKDEPTTIADGARTLAISETTFAYLKQLDGLYEITEAEIIYWTVWLTHLLKTMCEPTSALSMAAASRWLKTQTASKKILIILSGGNMDNYTITNIWQQNYLDILPNLNIDQLINN